MPGKRRLQQLTDELGDVFHREMAEIAEAVARSLERPVENMHVVYAPGASGRIGFGGVLTE